MTILGLPSFRATDRPSTVAALASAAGIALAGAVVWGLVALLFHVQLSVLGVLIGAGVGAMVARFRPGHLATMIAGGILAVLGCAFGTLLGEVFYLLSQHVAGSEIMANLNLLLRVFPRNAGVLGFLFYAIAALVAIRLPWQAGGRADAAAAASPPASDPPVLPEPPPVVDLAAPPAAAAGETGSEPIA